MSWREKPCCLEHYRPMDPLYYRDSSGTFKRWPDKYLCRTKSPGHIVDIKDLPVFHLV